MFASISKQLKRMGRFRIGFGRKLKGWEIIVFGIFILIFYMVYWSILLSLWAIYGVCYLCYLPFKFLLKQKNSEPTEEKNNIAVRTVDKISSVSTPATQTNAERYTVIRENAFDTLLSRIPSYNVVCSEQERAENINVKDFYLDFNKLRKNTNISRLLDFVSVDVKTTGLVPGKDKIIEISAIRFVEFEPVQIFKTDINPCVPIPEEASRINGITNDMVSDAPKIETVIPSLLEFIGQSTVIGYNLIFDLKFLRKFGLDLSQNQRYYFDVMETAHSIDTDALNHKLLTVCNARGIYFPPHAANSDSLATGLLFVQYIREKLELSSSDYPNLYLYESIIKNS